jgi:alpha 1,2-mannosyltransferase
MVIVKTKFKITRLIVISIVLICFWYFIFPSSSNDKITIDDDKENINFIKKSFPKKKVKATFVTLARNEDLYELLSSIQSIEDRFNHKFGYDWVFLNDVPFTEEFIKETTKSISGKTKYGVIPYPHWSIPIWINMNKAEKARKDMEEKNVIYGDSNTYRLMCRYESGFFFRHPLMDEYDYYWRVEPSVKFFCDIDYDIFQFMQENNKEYGFTIALREYIETIPTLWDTTKEFLNKNKNSKFIAENNGLEFISDDNGETYNLCHFWSNFEIGKLDFLRSKAYLSYFEYLDKSGGFFYERWGDAPIHSIAAALFLNKEKLHFFDDVGYYHGPFTSCPTRDDIRKKGRCSCNPSEDFTFQPASCVNKYIEMQG